VVLFGQGAREGSPTELIDVAGVAPGPLGRCQSSSPGKGSLPGRCWAQRWAVSPVVSYGYEMVATEVPQVPSKRKTLVGDLVRKFISGRSEVSVMQMSRLVPSPVVPQVPEQGVSTGKKFVTAPIFKGVSKVVPHYNRGVTAEVVG
jgi:hypothetical protein